MVTIISLTMMVTSITMIVQLQKMMVMQKLLQETISQEQRFLIQSEFLTQEKPVKPMEHSSSRLLQILTHLEQTTSSVIQNKNR